MKRLSIYFVLWLLSYNVFADTVYLRNGMAWFNVNILEAEETAATIIIWTSKRKKETISKTEIAGTTFNEYEPSRPSQYRKVDQEELPEGIEIDEALAARTALETEVVSEEEALKRQKHQIRDSLLYALPSFRMSLEGGYSWLNTNIPRGLTSSAQGFFQDIETGYNFGITLHQFFSPRFGLNLISNRFNSSARLTDQELRDVNQGPVIGDIKNELTIAFLGIGFTERYRFGNSGTLRIASIAIGMNRYEGTVTEIINEQRASASVSSRGLGLYGSLGFEHLVHTNIAFGGSVSYILARQKSFTINGEKFDLFEARYLPHLDFNLGFVTHF